jgi:hypothetical protein
MWTNSGLFAIALIGGAGLFLLLTSRGSLPMLLAPAWIILCLLAVEVRRRRLYNKPCPNCGVPLLGKLEGGIGRPKYCKNCLTVLDWDEDLNPLDTGIKME